MCGLAKPHEDPVQNQVQPCCYPLLLLGWVSACQYVPVLPTCCELEAATAEHRALMYLTPKGRAAASESRHRIPVIFLAWGWWGTSTFMFRQQDGGCWHQPFCIF